MNVVHAVRTVISDLVAKRLWPVAVVLLLGLVAVPVLLGGGDGEAPPAPVAQAAKPADETLVSMAEDGPTGGRTAIGRNPFRQHDVGITAPVLSASTLGSGSTSAPTGGTGSTGSGLDVGGGGVPGLDDIDVVPVGGGSGSDGGSPTAPRTDERDSYRVDLRFGRDGSLSSRRDVPRLAPLPSVADPFFVFLGVLADGKTALFLVSSDAQATGDGSCKPTPANCERVEMKAGDTEFFDVATPEGEVVQYQLDLVRVARQRSASAAVASAARARESTEGRKVLRSAVDTKQVDVSDLAFSRRLGLVVPTGAGQDERGALFGGFRVDLQFGAPGELVKRYNLARLTPLPSVEEPSFVYLGVIGDGDTALFLNPSEAAASGDAVCNPSPEDCTRVELKAGQSGLFDVPRLDGQTSEYQLDVDHITELEADSAEEADAMRRRESPAGRVILRRLIHEVGGLVADIDYSADSGAVVPRDEAPQDTGGTPAGFSPRGIGK